MYFASRATIAPIFAFTGVASTVLGILAARFEGDFELTPTGLKGRLLAVAAREDLTLEDKGDEMVRLVAPDTPDRRHVARAAWGAWLGSSSAMTRAVEFEKQAREYFESAGWQVEPPTGVFRPIGDFVARKDGETLVVEVKARSKLSAADVRNILATTAGVASIDQAPPFELVLVVPPGALSSAARAATEEAPIPVRILELPDGSGNVA